MTKEPIPQAICIRQSINII